MLPVTNLFSWQDKLIHAIAYAVMALLFWQSVANRISNSHQLALITLLFCALYGASDEWHQSFIAGRIASLGDWLADVSGALLLTLTLWKREVGVLNRSNT